MADRDVPVAAAVLLGAACALAGCSDRTGFARPSTATLTRPPTATAVLSSRIGSAQLRADAPRASADRDIGAALRPRRIALPHAEVGGHLAHHPEAVTLQFTGKAGQVLEVGLEHGGGEAAAEPKDGLAAIARDAAPTRADAALRVLIVDDGPTAPSYAELAALAAGTSELFLRLPADGDYVVHLRPPGAGLYRLSLELHAPLPFPVDGFDYTAIRSHFGASRESGTRRHEGVDIFAPRLTPVLAVADGRVSLNVEGRGGIAVVLSIAGISYYYAHLDRTAVGEGERVRIGDVLGYVGSTGNAHGSAPHLHFGVYQFGRGAIDPLPLLEERRFTDDAREPLAVLAAALAEEPEVVHGGAGEERPAALAAAAYMQGVSASGGANGGSGMQIVAAAALAAVVSGGCGDAGGASLAATEVYVGAGSAAAMAGGWMSAAELPVAWLAPSGAAVLCTDGT